jgi:hypothetical protein
MPQPTTRRTIDLRHPEYVTYGKRWHKWRLTYEGGQDFMDEFLLRYSKRETPSDFKERRQITYNPNHAKSVINIVRNAMVVKFPEIRRQGDPLYEEAMANDVDGKQSGMGTFLGVEVLPLLLAQGKRFIVLDAPPAQAGATQAQDAGRPYMYAVGAEDVLAWTYADNGNTLTHVLMQEAADVAEPATGLVSGSTWRYRFMRLLEAGEQYAGLTGPGVAVQLYDSEGKESSAPVLLPLTRLPVVEIRLVESLMTDIADMQITELNLASTDAWFLFKGNFPIYTAQYDDNFAMIKPRAAKRTATTAGAEQVTNREEGLVAQDAAQNVQYAGVNTGVGYGKDLERPDYIAPPVSNLEVSMKKQDAIAQLIRVMVDLALTSLSVKALEQSGKSKEADRVGEEAGLAYISAVLEAAERTVADIYHELLGSKTPHSVKYPTGYSVKTPEERRAEADSLAQLRTKVRSARYQKEIDKRIVELLLKPISEPAMIAAAQAEIEASAYFDDDAARSGVIQKDVLAGLVSKTTATALRGYPADEADAVLADEQLAADMLSGGPTIPPGLPGLQPPPGAPPAPPGLPPPNIAPPAAA